MIFSQFDQQDNRIKIYIRVMGHFLIRSETDRFNMDGSAVKMNGEINFEMLHMIQRNTITRLLFTAN